MMRLIRQAAHRIILPWFWSGVLGLCLVGCDQTPPPSALEKVKQQGVLHVVTRNSPVTYFEDRNGATGFDYELAKRFADKLGVQLQIEPVSSFDEVYNRVASAKQPIIGAASLVKTSRRSNQVAFSDSYLTIDSMVLYERSADRPTKVEDLIGKSILVIKGSSQADQLKLLKQEHPELTYQESDTVDIIDLLQQVEEKKVDITVINSNALAMTQVYYNNVRVAFTLEKEQQVAWAFTGNADDTSLIDSVNEFFAEVEQNGSLARLSDRFFGHLDTLGYVGAYSFARHLQDRLPKYEKYFVEYAKKYNLDWRLLAAIAYQESHWNPEAVSPTGVRGIMMLTQRTAKGMGVENRLDPEQSIMGGAKFLSIIKQGIGEEVPSPDRTYFALAAYNIGQGHLADVKKIAELNNLNPNSWRDVNQVLPLIAQKQWYQQTRYGYARGFETKQFVRNVRRYYDILNWLSHSQRELVNGEERQIHLPALSRNDNADDTDTTKSL